MLYSQPRHNLIVLHWLVMRPALRICPTCFALIEMPSLGEPIPLQLLSTATRPVGRLCSHRPNARAKKLRPSMDALGPDMTFDNTFGALMIGGAATAV